MTSSNRLDVHTSSDDEDVYICSNEYSLNGVGHYSIFNENEKDIRHRSLSMPYITCPPRNFVRSTSNYENSKGFLKESRKPRMLSVGDDKLMNYNRDLCNSNIHDNGKRNKIEEASTQVTHFCGFTKRQVKVGSTLLLLSFVDVMGFSIFAPFFPIVAEKKNLSSIQIGLIFSAYSMAGIVASVATGTLLVKIGPKFIIVSGMLWSAGSTICFGLLDMAPPEYFFTLCMICRLFMGIGSSASFTAIFAVIFHEFNERSLTMIGISESLCSIGGILGPVLGGALYDLGGFSLPFFFLGGSQGFVLVIIMFVIPSVEVEKQAQTVSPARLLLHPYAAFSTLFVVVSFTINSFIVANLSQFLTHSFGITALGVGVYMLVFSIFYGISTPIWGYIADSSSIFTCQAWAQYSCFALICLGLIAVVTAAVLMVVNTYRGYSNLLGPSSSRPGIGAHMMTVSALMSGVVMCFFGPCDLIKGWFGWSNAQQWLVYLCTAILGVCMGSIIMPTFGEMIIAAKEMRLQNNVLAEYGLVSGLWNTAFAIGDILGPTLGGVMVEKYDFANSLAIQGIAIFVLASAKGAHLIMIYCKKRDDKSRKSIDSNVTDREERRSLLNNPSVQA